MRVFLVDDHNIVVQGLKMRLDKEPDIEVTGFALSIHDALKELRKARPDVILVDLSLGDGTGLELLHKIKTDFPFISPIILTMHDESNYAASCVKAGARGYITKDQPFETVIKAIRTVMEGELFVSENTLKQLKEEKALAGFAPLNPIEALSRREREVFRHFGEGLRPRHIAEKLNISVGTIDAHCRNIRSKLQLTNMTELIEKAADWIRQTPL
ncbi:response regulator transcription factor [bacterium]|nr:response regulator transcription factor [bacterium]